MNRISPGPHSRRSSLQDEHAHSGIPHSRGSSESDRRLRLRPDDGGGTARARLAGRGARAGCELSIAESRCPGARGARLCRPSGPGLRTRRRTCTWGDAGGARAARTTLGRDRVDSHAARIRARHRSHHRRTSAPGGATRARARAARDRDEPNYGAGPYGVDRSRLTVVEPGVWKTQTLGSRPGIRAGDGALELLCVATLQEGKGHELLIDALAPLAHLPWRLQCVGSLSRNSPTVQRVVERLQRVGLRDRVALIGEVPHAALSELYLGADL